MSRVYPTVYACMRNVLPAVRARLSSIAGWVANSSSLSTISKRAVRKLRRVAGYSVSSSQEFRLRWVAV